MRRLSFVLGFLPWIVFTIVAQRLDANGVAWSALIAIVMTVVALANSRRKHGPMMLNLGSLVLFLVMAVVGFTGGPAVDQWLYQWGRPLVGVLLGLFVLVTVPIMPFTEEYARQTVPRQYWGSPTFRTVNRTLSAAWGAAILVIGVSSVVVAALDAQADGTDTNHVLDLLLNWAVPIAVIWYMIHFTSTYPDRVDKAADGGQAAEPAGEPPA